MPESFILTVQYKNLERDYNAELRMMGYTHKIAVMVEGVEVIFEPDEERNYRAVVQDTDKQRSTDIELLKAIASELEIVFK